MLPPVAIYTVQRNLFEKTNLDYGKKQTTRCELYYTSTFTMARYSIQNTDLSIIQIRPQMGQKSVREVIKRKKRG